VVHKKTRHFYFFDNSQILMDFRNFFTNVVCKELRNKNLLKFSLHLKSVAALPCET